MADKYVADGYVDLGYVVEDIYVRWPLYEIVIPRTAMTLIQSTPVEVRELDLNVLRLKLRDLEDDVLGRPWPKTHNHNEDVTVSGITLADVLLILEPFTVTFEDGLYGVNLVGANSNVFERTNKNSVSVNSANSAGLAINQGIAAQDKTDIISGVWAHADGVQLSTRMQIIEQILRNEAFTDPVSGDYVIMSDDGLSELFRVPIWENMGGTVPYDGEAINRRMRIE